MKKFTLLSGTAALIIAAAYNPAYAQSGYSQSATKGEERIMNETRRIEPESEPVAQAPEQRRTVGQTQTVSRIEPSGGYQEDGELADFTGFYGGAEGGWSFTDDVEGWDGGLFLGYGFEHNFNWLGAYAGLELGYNWSEADGSSAGTSYEKDHEIKASFRPGVSLWQDALGYGIVGYSRANFESGGDDEYLDGLMLGVGTQFDTGTPIKARLEYVHTRYGDEDIGGTNIDINENALKVGGLMQF